jgi:hypothetical protein
LDEITERHPRLVEHRDRAREEHAEAIAEGRAEGTVRKLARRSAELDEQVYGERRATELLAAKVEALREEAELAEVREAEERYREAEVACRAAGLALRERLLDLIAGELGQLCAEARSTLDELVTAERLRLVEHGGDRGGRPHAGVRVWTSLGLVRPGASLVDSLPNCLATLPVRIEQAAERAERRSGRPAPGARARVRDVEEESDVGESMQEESDTRESTPDEPAEVAEVIP